MQHSCRRRWGLILVDHCLHDFASCFPKDNLLPPYPSCLGTLGTLADATFLTPKSLKGQCFPVGPLRSSIAQASAPAPAQARLT